ncbi:hypothetical protein ACA910_004443 [Epithemia clementina (nom. ined.)]
MEDHGTTTSENQRCDKEKQDEEEKPKHPLSAYNLFFQVQRKRVLEGTDILGLPMSSEDIRTVREEHQMKRGKRIHRKTHGKIGFRDLARLVAKRWKHVDTDTRQLLKHHAAMEKAEFHTKEEIWKQWCSSLGQTTGSVRTTTSHTSGNDDSFFPNLDQRTRTITGTMAKFRDNNVNIFYDQHEFYDSRNDASIEGVSPAPPAASVTNRSVSSPPTKDDFFLEEDHDDGCESTLEDIEPFSLFYYSPCLDPNHKCFSVDAGVENPMLATMTATATASLPTPLPQDDILPRSCRAVHEGFETSSILSSQFVSTAASGDDASHLFFGASTPPAGAARSVAQITPSSSLSSFSTDANCCFPGDLACGLYNDAFVTKAVASTSSPQINVDFALPRPHVDGNETFLRSSDQHPGHHSKVAFSLPDHSCPQNNYWKNEATTTSSKRAAICSCCRAYDDPHSKKKPPLAPTMSEVSKVQQRCNSEGQKGLHEGMRSAGTNRYFGFYKLHPTGGILCHEHADRSAHYNVGGFVHYGEEYTNVVSRKNEALQHSSTNAAFFRNELFNLLSVIGSEEMEHIFD